MEPQHIGEALRALLENADVKRALADVFYTGISSPAEFEEMSLSDHFRHARGIDVSETPFDDLAESLQAVLQSLVIDRLPQPGPITLGDLTSLAVVHLAGVDLSQVNGNQSVSLSYERFVTSAVLEIEQHRYRSFSDSDYCMGDDWALPEAGSSLHEYMCNYGPSAPDVPCSDLFPAMEIWRSQSGFSFNFSIYGHFLGSCDRVYGRFSGYCTDAALTELAAQFNGIMDSIVKTVSLSWPGDVGLTPINFLSDGDGQRVFAASITACSQADGTGKATVLDRLRNAIVLLSHADSTADPIGLSLSFAAIEALVCEKHGKPVNQQIKEHVSTLLVQRDHIETLAAERKARERVLGKLYDIRCEVLHGNQVSAPDKAAGCVRRIAAGVVRAVVSWKENQERTGADTSWKELMDELNAASRKPAVVVGVPDLSELIPAKVPD